ncbi:MAG: phosphopantetheine-binding protein [Rubrivivax sp. SCN 71-131]|jgi:acyl carrier protein|nr:MAG: phosphopantetheine-binding protein [Rubrivivax sp. SCN 71-131]
MSSLAELQELIERKYGIAPAQLDPQGSMRGSGIDSLALVEFIFEVEERFGITLQSDPDVDTLADLARLIDEQRAAKATASPA